MKALFLFFSLLCLLSTSSFAGYVAVLETSADSSAKDSVSLSDRQYLTNVLREQAIKELPVTQGYTIMTRENILQMLPPGKAIEDCEGSCLVETGKNIAADYICQARVGRFRNSLTLSAELYETAGNKLIASFNGRGEDVEKLLGLIEREAHNFFSMVRVMAHPVSSNVVEEKKEESIASVNEVVENKAAEKIDIVQAVDEPKVILSDSAKTELAKPIEKTDVKESKVGESIPANVNTDVADASAKKNEIHWVPISISAAVTVVGAVLAVVGNHKAKEASEKKYSTEAEYKKFHDDAKSGQTLRGVGIGIAIAGAVGVGLSIAF